MNHKSLLSTAAASGMQPGSGLRRIVCLAALLVVFATNARAYDLWVGGVQVTTSNASDITGSNIKGNLSSVNGGNPKVNYVSSTNTLYLYNVKIERTGKNNHAIENKGMNGLRIVLRGQNVLKATGSSAVRLDKNTTITTTYDGNQGVTYIEGGSEDALYVSKNGSGDSPIIEIKDAVLDVKSESSCFDTNCSPTLVIDNSTVYATCTYSKAGDCYAVFDFNLLTIRNSTVTLYTLFSGGQAINNLASLNLGNGMYIETPSGGSFNSSSKTVVNSSGKVASDVVFKMGPAVNSTNFPDANFRNFISSQSYGSDGYLTPSEIQNVTSLTVSGKKISNLKGIEYFTALTSLNCSNNSLTSLDLSKNKSLMNVYCHGNKINGTNASTLVNNLPSTSGATLYFYDNGTSTGNSMTEAEVKDARQKRWSVKQRNSSGDWTDFPGYDAIVVVINETNFPDDNFRNWLLEQSYGKDGNLTFAEIAAVTKIDVLGKRISSLKGIEYFQALNYLDCYYNELKDLDVSKNTALTYLKCSSNGLTTLDVSKNTALTYLKCSSNRLTSLDLSKNTALTNLDCYSNGLISLDLSKNTALTNLDCYSNGLISLDLSKNTALIYLDCRKNKLTSLDLSKNTALTVLYCDRNQLTSLDVSKNTALTYLCCYNNGLETLDVSKNTALTDLYCSNNGLTSLDVSKNTALETLDCAGNQISGDAMANLVNSLPSVTGDCPFIVCDDNRTPDNVITTVQVEIATDKGWMVKKNDSGYDEQDYVGLGDVNGDKKIDQTDLDTIVDIIMGRVNLGYAGDLNNDGKTNAADVVKMVNVFRSLGKGIW